jgi:siroheme synthase
MVERTQTAAERFGLPPDAIAKARAWKAEHTAHVERLMSGDPYLYRPTGSDVIRPELWKGAHWNWLGCQK